MKTAIKQQMIKKDVDARIKAVDTTERQITFIATHRQIDRTGEVVEPDGVNLASFRRNPTLLLHHDQSTQLGR